MLRRLRRNMALLCASGVCVIGTLLVIVSLVISEAQIVERGRALFLSHVGSATFRVSSEAVVDWKWLQRLEAEGRMLLHIEDNGNAMLFSVRDPERKAMAVLIEQAQRTAAQQYDVDTTKRPTSALSNAEVNFQLTAADGTEYRASVTVFRTEQGFRSVTALGDMSHERAEVWQQRVIYLVLLVGCITALLLFSWWFTGWAIRPIAQNHKQQAEFIAAASHELRTPLAVIRTSAAALHNGEENRFVGAIERESVRMSKLVDDLLALANADANRWRVELTPVEISEVLANSVENFGAAAEKGLELCLQLPPMLPVLAGDEFRLRQLLGILLDNACQYTPVDGRIVVRGSQSGKWVEITVADTGAGISPELYDKVFERFYRVDAARSKKEHYGLGLSIAKEIVHLHLGRISLSETPGGGLTVTILLPVAGRL